jgi:hypothetical protein
MIINIISPDNFNKKLKELRIFLFGEQFKTENECFNDEISFNP